ncbi:trypsin-like serine protease [Streptomyces sp. AN091965]|uniref:trypsin-like serine protease n=1 Tax=Streptomyces sp. AN091965 TaxID=2927803 RepID=UPI001F60DC6E|nr:trypsin-like serine protease [Streptomyces sp. AN091965]MCI3927889.1 trypsin-like serine protease [Streptomyces sp. AN091965]
MPLTRPLRLVALATAMITGPLALSAAVPVGAVSGTATTSSAYAFAARLDIGDGERACSGALVDPRWVLTAASCFVDAPASGATPEPGKPAKKTVATIGRTDLTGTGGLVTEVVELVPHPSRDLVMARLAQPTSGIAPISPATTAPGAGETLKAAGYGRTRTEWSPLTLHTGSFTVDAVQDGQVAITGQGGAAVCAGDTGGPLIREQDGKTELVAVNSRSWQGGCFGQEATETRTGALSGRVDDGAAQEWAQEARERLREVVSMADINGDGADDLVIQGADGTITVRTAVKNFTPQPGKPAYRFSAGVHWSAGWSNFLGLPGQGRLYFGDVNGDSEADLIVHGTDGNISVRVNKGTYFDGGTHWSAGWSNFLGHPGKGRLYFGDVNGDSKADLIVHGTDGNVSVRVNKGTYFDGGTHWSAGWSNFLGHPGKGRLYFGDVNGDSKADLIVHGTDGNISVRVNKGTYFDGGTHWSAGWSNFLGHPGKGHLYFGDVNADKKADLVVHSPDGKVGARLNTGTYFATAPGDDWI